MTRMDPLIKARWVAALRSGEYKQGTGELRAGNHFCCLGVLCDVKDNTRWEAMDGRTSHRYRDDDADWQLPPHSMKAWAGFDWQKLEVEIDGERMTLADHNDHGATFAQIADAIEAQL